MSLNTTSFFNSNEVHISSRMNEYMKKNFGYEVEGDIDTLREARKSLQAEQLELKKEYMSKKYVENMFMIETISALLKAHGETSPVQEDKYSDLNPTNKFGYFGGPGFYSNDGSTYTEPHYDDFDIRQHNRDNPEDKIKLNNWDDFNLKMRYHKKDGKRVQGYGGMGYNVSFHGNPKDVEAFATQHLDAEGYSGDNIPESIKEDDGLIKRQDGKYDQADIAYGKDDYMIKKDPATGEYDPDEIRQMQYQQNIADPLNREIDSSKKATTIEVDYDLELDKPKSQNPLLKKHYKEMRKFNVFISMPEWQEGPKDSGFGVWTAKIRGSKKNLLGWLKAWEYDYDKEQLEDMGLGESVKAVKEDDEEKGVEHYRWKNESQLSHVKDKIESAMEELDHAIEYRSENSDKFFTGFEERAGVGSLLSIKGTLQKVLDRWEKDTEFYGM